jgi:hypothetical protein
MKMSKAFQQKRLKHCEKIKLDLIKKKAHNSHKKYSKKDTKFVVERILELAAFLYGKDLLKKYTADHELDPSLVKCAKNAH